MGQVLEFWKYTDDVDFYSSGVVLGVLHKLISTIMQIRQMVKMDLSFNYL